MVKIDLQLFGGRGAGSGKVKTVDFTTIIRSSDNMIHSGKNFTISPKGYRPEMVNKSDIANAIERYNIEEFVMDAYRDRTGANDIKRIEALGYEIDKQYLGTVQNGSKIPPMDYFHFRKRRNR